MLNSVKLPQFYMKHQEKETPAYGYSHGFHYHTELIKNTSTPGKYLSEMRALKRYKSITLTRPLISFFMKLF